MSIKEIWLILTFVLMAVIACYGFCKIVGDGQKLYRVLAGFIWLISCASWFVIFAYFVTTNI